MTLIKKEHRKKTQIESINNRKQTIKFFLKHIQIKLENEWNVWVGDDLYS